MSIHLKEDSRRLKKRGSLALVAAVVVVMTAACGSSSSDAGGSSSSGTDASVISAADALIQKHLAIPTKILQTEKITPKPGVLYYNISCNLAIVGCGEISKSIGTAVKGIGGEFKRCNAGATPSKAAGCFTNAVNAKADVIVNNDVPLAGSGNGYAQATAAKIPIIGAFTGDPLPTTNEPTQAAADAPRVEAQLLADYVISKSKGKANVLYLGESQDGSGAVRGRSFASEMKKCHGCSVKTIELDQNTQETSAPPQITAALNSNPKLNWVIGNADGAAAIAVTSISKLGLGSKIQVGGMDANPQNIQYLKDGKQAVDVTVGQGEVAWAAVYAAARVASGLSVDQATPTNIWLIDKSNVDQVPASGVFFGPQGYEKQFLSLMGK
ncbi:MAG: hypothetical protein JWN39_2881 [Ilumatobacteraceae bacterium]|nr:hypothetical protein [Ilumatobacteraceae bacterium]